MKERPIIFCGDMVLAILAGRKRQTRRLVNRDLWDYMGDECATRLCPYGHVGDRLWVRETWAPCHQIDSSECPSCEGIPSVKPDHDHSFCYRATHDGPDPMRWRPSIHMPRRASRITLEVTGIRVERVKNITEADALAEGVEVTGAPPRGSARMAFAWLWDGYNSRRGYSWESNPWVWVIEFQTRASALRGQHEHEA